MPLVSVQAYSGMVNVVLLMLDQQFMVLFIVMEKEKKLEIAPYAPCRILCHCIYIYTITLLLVSSTFYTYKRS